MRRALHIAGWLLSIAAAAYFVIGAAKTLHLTDLAVFLEPQLLCATMLLMALYMLLVPVTAATWYLILCGMGTRPRGPRLLAILATTQIGKYLPGNVAQHIGRVALAHTPTLPLTTLVLSVGYETLLLIIAGMHLSALLLGTPLPALAQWPIIAYRWPIFIALNILIPITIAAVPVVGRFIARRRVKSNTARQNVLMQQPPWAMLLIAYFGYLLNFILTGLGLWAVASTLAPSATLNPLYFIGAFATSWVLGFLVPGAPAGLGIREAILSAIFAGTMAPANIIIMIVALRVATTLGDLLVFAAGGTTLFSQNRRLAAPARTSK